MQCPGQTYVDGFHVEQRCSNLLTILAHPGYLALALALATWLPSHPLTILAHPPSPGHLVTMAAAPPHSWHPLGSGSGDRREQKAIRSGTVSRPRTRRRTRPTGRDKRSESGEERQCREGGRCHPIDALRYCHHRSDDPSIRKLIPELPTFSKLVFYMNRHPLFCSWDFSLFIMASE